LPSTALTAGIVQTFDGGKNLGYGFAMHGHTPHRNPLSAAAQEIRAVARETRWRWLEYVAMGIMAASAAVTTAIGALQIRHMLKREVKEEQREQERERRADASSPPPDRPGHNTAATAGMPPHGRDDEEGRWTRRAEHAEAAGHGRRR
jgi:hypothetical protein